MISISENNWKAATKAFDDQLSLNQFELRDNKNYPSHWYEILDVINLTKATSVLDIGCGTGSVYKLIKAYNGNIFYKGIDIAPYAIDLARKNYDQASFIVYNFRNLSISITDRFDLLYAGALLDILPDGDDCLKFLLNLQPKWLLIGRMELSENTSHYTEYRAYDKIETYKHYHSRLTVEKIANELNYDFYKHGNSVLFKR